MLSGQKRISKYCFPFNYLELSYSTCQQWHLKEDQFKWDQLIGLQYWFLSISKGFERTIYFFVLKIILVHSFSFLFLVFSHHNQCNYAESQTNHINAEIPDLLTIDFFICRILINQGVDQNSSIKKEHCCNGKVKTVFGKKVVPIAFFNVKMTYIPHNCQKIQRVKESLERKELICTVPEAKKNID